MSETPIERDWLEGLRHEDKFPDPQPEERLGWCLNCDVTGPACEPLFLNVEGHVICEACHEGAKLFVSELAEQEVKRLRKALEQIANGVNHPALEARAALQSKDNK